MECFRNGERREERDRNSDDDHKFDDGSYGYNGVTTGNNSDAHRTRVTQNRILQDVRCYDRS